MDSTATSGQVDVAIRKRAAKACDQCRRRKTKCDGTANCAACRSINLNCSYGYHMRQARGPAYVAYLEAKVESLEEQIKRMSEGSSSSNSPVVSSDGSRNSSMSSQFTSSDRASQFGAPSGLKHEENPVHEYKPAQQQTMNLGPPIIHHDMHQSQQAQLQSQSYDGPGITSMQNESYNPTQMTHGQPLHLEGGSLFARRVLYPRPLFSPDHNYHSFFQTMVHAT